MTVTDFVFLHGGDSFQLKGRTVLSRRPSLMGKITDIGMTRGMEEVHINWDNGKDSVGFIHQCENEVLSWGIVTKSGQITDISGSCFITDRRDYLDARIVTVRDELEQKYKEKVSIKPVRLVANKYWEVIEPYAFDGELTAFIYDV